LRLALAIPLGFAFAALVKEDLGPFIAFAVGAFPLGDLLTMLRQIGNEKLNLKVGQAPTGSRVVQLLGVDPSTADRVEDADISTIPQLSTCDPVDLAMRTCLQFRFVLNMCDQALVWVYFGCKPDDKGTTKLDALRPLGLASAFEVRDLVNKLADPAQAAGAQAVLNAAAAATGLPADGLKHTFQQIAEAPHAQFLFDALSGAAAGSAPAAQAAAVPAPVAAPAGAGP